MSPSLPAARPFWVWSLPAFAVLLSLLWYRKKRGSLKTDSGGSGETRDDNKSVESEEEARKVLSKSAEVSGVLLTEVTKNNKEEGEGEAEAIKAVAAEGKLTEVAETVSRLTAEPMKSSVAEEERRKTSQDKQETRTSDKTEKNNNNNDDVDGVKPDTGRNDTEELIKGIEESIISQGVEETRQPEIQGSRKSSDEVSAVKSQCGKKKKMKNASKKAKEASAGTDRRSSKEENTACILEKKLAKLELGNPCNGARGDEKDVGGDADVAERDSANNSPSEVMLASPSVSGYSDTHSEGSSDSGKGCSEMLTPSRTPASGNSVSGDLPVTSIYEFVIPQHLVGRLIGRYGSYVNEIKETTHASIYIKRHPDTSKLKICAVEGTQMDIESALDMIRQKFPKKRYPNVTLEQVVIAPEPQMIPIISESMQLYLIEGINNDVLLSSLVSAGHFFLQQPTHPTYLSLSRLNSCMNYCYSEPDQPEIPEGVGAGILCAAPVHNGWYRAQIVSMDDDNKMCDVKFVDYGGYMTMPVSLLRQIRFDFVNLPFQAAECYLASVKPANEENVWCEKSKKLVEDLTFGKVLQAQVYGYAEDGVPLIYLYTVSDDKVVLVNEELVKLGLAEWICLEVNDDEFVECEIDETAPMAVAAV